MSIISNLTHWAAEGRIALVDDGGPLAFADLDRRSNAVANWLLATQPARKPVVLWGDKEHDMAVCLYGALKSGRPYVVIPDHFPASRVATILTDCEASVVFSVSETPLPVQHPCHYGSRDIDAWTRLYPDLTVPAEKQVQDDDICCIFYTSGSTGKPKGVQISRANIEALLDWWLPIIQPSLPETGGRALNFSSYAYSTALDNIFSILDGIGLTLHAVSRTLAMDYQNLFEYILAVDPHYLTCTPSFATVCLQDERFCAQHLPSLKVISIGGENLPLTVGRKLLQRFPDILLWNGYGCTETTIGAIACLVTPEMLADGKAVRIGEIAAGSAAYVVDDNRQEVPDGEVGELVMVSPMISQGYLNNPERTAQNFFVAPDGRRGYYTGDLVFREANQFYYVGRKDHQVKVGGYRVELEDVEQHLHQVSLIKDCVAVPVTRDGQVVMLAAYVTLKESAGSKLASIMAIKKEMADMVQAYMVPQKIVILDELPYNTNGKVDRAALKEQAKLPSAHQ